MNTARYKSLFEDSPASLWELDLSAVRVALRTLQLSGFEDLAALLEKEPERGELIVADLCVLDINAATLELFEASSKNVVCDAPLSCFPGEARRRFAVACARLLRGAQRSETVITCRTLSGRTVDVSARLTVAPGSEERWESVFLAMTDVSWVREVRERERRLIDADKMASLGQLAAGFAHEISNPNQAIALCGQVLEDAWPDISGILDHHAAEVGDYSLGGDAYSEMRLTLQRCVSSLASSSRRIQATVDALKQFALLEDDEAMIPTEVNLVVQAALRLAAPLLRKATEKAEVTLGAGMPRVMGRPRRLEQVVLDLVKNACQALPERSRALAVRTYAEDGFVILEVEDQGIGMDADELRRAREPFYTTRRAAGGLGLGLSTAHDIVTQHAGRMDIRSIAGKGTCVVVRLPGAAAEGAT